MMKHYRTLLVAFIGVLVFGLTVSTSARIDSSGQGIAFGVSVALAEGDEGHHYGADGYDEEGYDREGRDRDGYDHDGYSRDGHRRDRSYDKERDHKKKDHAATSGSAQPFVVKPEVNQY